MNEWVSDSCVCSWGSFPPVGLPCPAWFEDFCNVLLSFVLSSLAVLSLRFVLSKEETEEEWILERGRGKAGRMGRRARCKTLLGGRMWSSSGPHAWTARTLLIGPSPLPLESFPYGHFFRFLFFPRLIFSPLSQESTHMRKQSRYLQFETAYVW